eukprot:TRINITY_DN35645_c0_g1_i1.p1 TRINITY_DN35645_c0_g1~~TRINITY_DN35645_c0_g1_i1.p1  ORF type:complete len:192 (+),score=87.68 TRINITY_DN35645_c0_g1_i1:58-576(+)
MSMPPPLHLAAQREDSGGAAGLSGSAEQEAGRRKRKLRKTLMPSVLVVLTCVLVVVWLAKMHSKSFWERREARLSGELESAREELARRKGLLKKEREEFIHKPDPHVKVMRDKVDDARHEKQKREQEGCGEDEALLDDLQEELSLCASDVRSIGQHNDVLSEALGIRPEDCK